MSPYLKLDLEASLVAERLRIVHDDDLKRIPTMPPSEIGKLCSQFKTHKAALFKAAVYEINRRKANRQKEPL